MLLLRHTIPLLYSGPQLKPGSVPLTCSQEHRVSEWLNTCQSDPRWQAALLLPTLITQINIKLNTRPCTVNFYVVKNDWLFASLHRRDQTTREGYQSVGLPVEIPLCSFTFHAYIIVSVPSQRCTCNLCGHVTHNIVWYVLNRLGKALLWDCLPKCAARLWFNEF